MNKVYIGVGTNLGNKRLNILQAYNLIAEKVGAIQLTSSFYKTPPWGFESDQDFINTVILVATDLEIHQLLDALKIIECDMGRTQRGSEDGYADRVIDLDIIDFGQEVFSSERITVPHDKMHLRNFVVFPLAEISPKWYHPALKRDITTLLKTVANLPPIEKLY